MKSVTQSMCFWPGAIVIGLPGKQDKKLLETTALVDPLHIVRLELLQSKPKSGNGKA
jgi:hypothetical protein